MEDFNTKFNDFIDKQDYVRAHALMLKELGDIIATNKKEFVALLNASGIKATINDSDLSLIEKFVINIPFNQQLMLGSSLLIQLKNKKIGFDGVDEIDDTSMKNCYKTMRNYYSSEPKSNFLPALAGLFAGGGDGGSIIGTATNLLTANKRKQEELAKGSIDILQKQNDARQQLINSVLEKKKADVEAKKVQSKNLKTALIVSGAVLLVTIVGIVIYKIKKK
jgi:hypothetical protein